MSKASLYTKFHDHLLLLRTNGMSNGLTGDYVCPLCLTSYTQQVVNTDAITIEHAPQHALGGHEKALTCKECNNGAGSEIDCHLDNLIQRLEFKEQVDGSKREGSFEVSGQRIHGSLTYNNGNCELRLPVRSNDTRINLGGLMTTGDEFEFEGKKVKYNANCGIAAMLKNAYILLFARIGYPILASAHYDILRNYINDPYNYFLPRPLCRIEPSSLYNDGVYLFQRAKEKGFVVVYSVIKNSTEKVFVFLPAICTSFVQTAGVLRDAANGRSVMIRPLPDMIDFLNDMDKAQALIRWAHSRTMTMQEVCE